MCSEVILNAEINTVAFLEDFQIAHLQTAAEIQERNESKLFQWHLSSEGFNIVKLNSTLSASAQI